MDVEDLKAGAEMVHAAARKHTDPDLADLCAAGGSYTEAIAALASLAGQNVNELRRLPSRANLSADDGKHPGNYHRAAMIHLEEMRQHLNGAYEAARLYHSAMSHLGDLGAPDE